MIRPSSIALDPIVDINQLGIQQTTPLAYSALNLFSRDEILAPTPLRDIRYTGQLSRRDLSADTCPRHPLYWPAQPPLPCSAQDRT
jgi:hypothetical protein